MRKYYPIWHKLKAEGKCEISAPVKFHPRIIKKVINEKYIDDGFKYLLSEADKKCKLSYIREGVKIIFTLHYSIGVEDL